MKSTEQILLEEELATNKSISINHKLLKKLKLYQIYSEINLKIKSQKSELSKIIEKEGIIDEEIIKTKSDLNKQIIENNKELKTLKNSIAQLIMTTNNPYSYLAELNNELADEIGCIIVNNKELNKKLKSSLIREISVFYGLNQENIILEEKKIGKQDGFIIKDKSSGLKLFTKTSKIFGNDTKSIDPRELFVYKVLEYMELGPETHFIITAGSSNLSGAKICHIVTKDVEYSDNKDIKNIFFTDNFITKEDLHNDALLHWEASLNNKEFRIKFLALSIVNDLLHLNDSFATNPWNYGAISQESKVVKSQYKPTLIDHEVRNSLFKYEPHKNPIISLIEKLKINSNNKNKAKELISYKVIKDNNYFTKLNQIQSELSEAIKLVNVRFSEIIKSVVNEIQGIMFKFKESFSEEAHNSLKEYLSQTEKNIELFNEMQNYYIDNVEEISKGVIKLLSYDFELKEEGFNINNNLFLLK